MKQLWEEAVMRLLHALVVVLLVCAALRLAVWLIAPVLPLLGAMAVYTTLALWLLSGPRTRDRWR